VETIPSVFLNLAMIEGNLTLITVLLLAGVVAMVTYVVRRGKPRPKLNVVRSDPPARNPDDPAFIRRRAAAAAAAIVYHRKQHATGKTHENS
jgi:hypothetical protein